VGEWEWERAPYLLAPLETTEMGFRVRCFARYPLSISPVDRPRHQFVGRASGHGPCQNKKVGILFSLLRSESLTTVLYGNARRPDICITRYVHMYVYGVMQVIIAHQFSNPSGPHEILGCVPPKNHPYSQCSGCKVPTALYWPCA
jgi:hypothetical protein